MKTPDGKEFTKEEGPAPPSVAAEAALSALRGLGSALFAALMILLRAIGKFCITTWRLAAALDSALWRGCKLLARRAMSAINYAARLIAAAVKMVLLWLPTRTGRAYSAVSGIVLVLAALWIVDVLRATPDPAIAGDRTLRPPIDEEDPILARIDGRYVHLSEIEAAARAGGFLRPGEQLTPDSAFSRELVESYVEQRLLARAARDEGLHRNPAVARRTNAARDRVLASTLMENRIAENVTPALVERMYQQQSDISRLGEEVRARHIVVETKEEADEVRALLLGGADFSTLARERSLDRATAPLGGEVGWFTASMMTPTFSRAAFSTANGELSAPFETEYGWHILEVTGRRSGASIPLDEVRDGIEEFLRMRTIEATVRDLEDDAQVVYFRPEPELDEIAPAPEIPDVNQGSDPTAEDS